MAAAGDQSGDPIAERPVRTRRLRYLSDLPVAEESRDALGFRAYAEALAAIIDSRGTGTPLSLAISAPWGAGKTSLARLVEADLKQRTVERRFERPNVTCWFNAWMHNDAPHLGAAMAAAVAAEAGRRRPVWRKLVQPVPAAMLSPRGRWLRRFGMVVIAVALVGTVLSLSSVREAVAGSKAMTDIGIGNAGWLAFVVVAGILLLSRLHSIYDGVARFFSDPKAEASRGSLEGVRRDLGKLIRHGIRKGRLVVFIDDLERCKPERAIEVCEVATQLLAHEGVVVVFIADMELIAASAETRYATTGGSVDVGRRFLEKIVQIQLTLPPPREPDIERLLKAGEPGSLVEETEPAGPDDAKPEAPTGFFPWSALMDRVKRSPELAPLFIVLFALSTAVVFELLAGIWLEPDPLMEELGVEPTGLETLLGIPAGTAPVDIVMVLIWAANGGLLLTLAAAAAADWATERRARSIRERIEKTIEAKDGTRQDELEAAVVAAHPKHAAVARTLVRTYLIDAAEELDEVEAVILKYPPPLPRGAKRMLNHARLLTQIARTRQMFDDVLTAEHLGEWIVINERWRPLARRIERDPQLLKRLEDAVGCHEREFEALLAGDGLAADDVRLLRQLLTDDPRLGEVAERLVHFQPAPGSSRAPTGRFDRPAAETVPG